MTIREVKERVEKIRASAGDYEVAHGMEDDLYEDFVRTITSIPDGLTNWLYLIKLAKEVIKTKDIDFARYYT